MNSQPQRTRESIVDEAWQTYGSHIYRVADKIVDYYDGEEKTTMLDDCLQAMAMCCDLETEFKHKQEMVEKTSEAMSREENRERTVKDIFTEEMEESGGPPKKDYKKHTMYKNLLKVIKDAEKRAGASATGRGEGSGDEEGEGEEDLLMTDMQVNTLDPFTKLEMKDPVMSSKCKHTYERASVMAMLKDKPRIRCPTPGCGWITISDLVPNMEMKRILEERQTKKRR